MDIKSLSSHFWHIEKKNIIYKAHKPLCRQNVDFTFLFCISR